MATTITCDLCGKVKPTVKVSFCNSKPTPDDIKDCCIDCLRAIEKGTAGSATLSSPLFFREAVKINNFE